MLQRKSRGKIDGKNIPLIYNYASQYASGKVSRQQALVSLTNSGLVSQGSASAMLRIMQQMFAGNEFSRSINESTADYFLTHILTDFGKNNLANAVNALSQHLVYYKRIRPKVNLHTLNAVMEKHRLKTG